MSLLPKDLNTDRRLQWVAIAACLGWMSALLISFPLWGVGRDYPVYPFIPGWPSLPASLDFVLPLLLMALPFGLLIEKYRRPLAITTEVVLIFGMLGDHARVQPWILHYLLIFTALSLRNKAQALAAIRFSLICIYFWSGAHKITVNFMEIVWPWLLDPLVGDADPHTGVLNAIGYLVPIIELGMGICLLIPRLRFPAIVAATGMHLFILLAIGPAGYGWNYVVWPWNIVMILMVWIVWYGDKMQYAFSQLRSYAGVAVILLFGILPAPHFFGLGDTYLSLSLYSGRASSATIVADAEALLKMPPTARDAAEAIGDGLFAIYPDDWAMRAMGAPGYPEPRIYIRMFEELCEQVDGAGGLTLTISYPTLGGIRFQDRSCYKIWPME